MKKALAIPLVFVLFISVLSISPIFANPQTQMTVPSYTKQWQWRGTSPYGNGAPIENGWSNIQNAYDTTTDYTFNGHILQTFIDYSPFVTDQEGGLLVYHYKPDLELWTLQKTEVSYNYAPAYGDYRVTNFFCGYLEFDGTPSATTFVHGVLYQWVYIFAEQTDDVTAIVPYAEWDVRMGAWLVGFSIYVDNELLTDMPANADIPFPEPMIEPVPASIFDPLNL